MDAKTFLGSHVPLFAGISDEHLTDLAVSSELKSYKAGQTILFQGMTVDDLHVVAVGKVSIHAKVAGRGVVQVAELGPGEIFGETSILESGTAGATVKAAQDGTYVLVVPQEAFRRLVAESPDFVARLKALIDGRKALPRA
ncbi:MAG: hypothetical protein A2V88_14700 [Elusimicrobia bacterium RBG_16_66_12]|nr:MAG: hypothetical protein A2V88_14700 [Elusimicrobia bacterium RBG_16_66_12]